MQKVKNIKPIVEKLKSKIKHLASDGALHIVAGSFATKFVAFFGSIFVVRLLSKADYGILSYAENIYSYAFIVAGYGLLNATLRYIIIAGDEKKRAYFDRIIKNALIFDFLLAVVVLVINGFVKYPDEFQTVKIIMPILALLIPFQDLVNILLSYLRAIFKNKLYAYASFVVSALLILGRVAGAYISGAHGVALSRLLLNAAFAIIGLFLIFKFFLNNKERMPLTKSEKKEMDIYSLQYMLTNGLWAVFMLNDTFLLGQIIGSSSLLADYKVACVLPGNIAIFATAIGTYVGPKFTQNESNTVWVKNSFKKTLSITSLVMFVVCFAIWVLSTPLIKFLYGEQYLSTIPVMTILLVGAFLNSGIRYTVANILGAMGMISYNMKISIGGVILQILLDVLLIPRIGAYGAAISNCIVYALMSIALLLVFAKKFFWKGNKT